MKLSKRMNQENPDYAYTLEVLGRTTDAMATGRGNLKSRLVSAMVSLLPLDVSDFPDNLQARFESIVQQCAKNRSKEIIDYADGRIYRGPSDTLLATIPTMRWSRCDAIARELLALENELNFRLELERETILETKLHRKRLR